jgi:hypothetical protein
MLASLGHEPVVAGGQGRVQAAGVVGGDAQRFAQDRVAGFGRPAVLAGHPEAVRDGTRPLKARTPARESKRLGSPSRRRICAPVIWATSGAKVMPSGSSSAAARTDGAHRPQAPRRSRACRRALWRRGRPPRDDVHAQGGEDVGGRRRGEGADRWFGMVCWHARDPSGARGVDHRAAQPVERARWHHRRGQRPIYPVSQHLVEHGHRDRVHRAGQRARRRLLPVRVDPATSGSAQLSCSTCQWPR